MQSHLWENQKNHINHKKRIMASSQYYTIEVNKAYIVSKRLLEDKKCYTMELVGSLNLLYTTCSSGFG